MSTSLTLRLVCAAAICLGASSTAAFDGRRTAVIAALPREASWKDLALLAALPAAAAETSGKPVLITAGENGELAPETAAFLGRFHPDRIVRIPEDDLDGSACAIAKTVFGKITRVVACPEDDYGAALCASALAARLEVPLLFCGATKFSAASSKTLGELGASSLLLVGNADRVGVDAKIEVERLRDGVQVVRWMQRHSLPVKYLAAANPSDRTAGSARKLSLAAAVLAAGREGAVVPVDLPPAAVSAENARRVQAVKAELAKHRAAAGVAPEYLCLVGMPDVLPMEVVASKEAIDKDPVSDLGYGDIDADPFVDLAVGRFVGEDGAAALLLAARSLAYEELVDPSWSGRFATAEWECEYGELFESAGFEAAPHLPSGTAISSDSPLANVAAIVHSSHASWLELGSTYSWNSKVLLAPCIVESAGCSTASIDQDAEHRSVAARLLRNGAVAFVGNVRRTVAQYELYRSEFWNAVLSGESLGRAHRRALNHLLVTVLDEGEQEQGLHRYELTNAAFYGDPALVLHRPTASSARPARAEQRGGEIVVHAPSTWWSSRIAPPEDWKRDPSAAITTYRGFGVGADDRWDEPHRRNLETLYFVVDLDGRQRVSHLRTIGRPPPPPLGWSGKFWTDEHADGTRSTLFRVRLLDFDMDTGAILHSVESLRFRVD